MGVEKSVAITENYTLILNVNCPKCSDDVQHAMKISIHKRKKILLLFLLGIAFPSLLLGYLAFRGIRNDQALLEKERLNEHRRITGLVSESIEKSISEIEQSFVYIIAENKKLSSPALINSLDSLKQKKQLVEEIFFFQNFEKIQFPLAKPLFLPNGSLQPFTTVPRNLALVEKVQTGEQFEFKDNRYQKALASYQQAVKETSDRQLKGELLSAMARVQKKSILFIDAIKTYEMIAQDYGDVQTTGGIPLGLSARLEIGNIYMATNDTLKAINIFLELYKDLIRRKWTLEKAQYEFLSQYIEEPIDSILSKPSLAQQLESYQNTFRMLKIEENGQREITERLLTFQLNATKDLQKTISRNLEDAQRSAGRFIMESEGQSYFVSLLSQMTKNGSQVDGIWGILLNADYLKNNLLKPALESNVYSEKTGWIVKGTDGIAIMKSENSPSGSVTVRANFEGNFPPWFIEFYQQAPQLFETVLISRRGIYFYTFFLIAGILIFGLVLTFRAVAHDLELAKMKSDFVSTISHEFKSPLTSIRQLAEMLQAGRVPSDERLHRYYDILVEQSERLSLLIDNILDFAKIEEGKKKFTFEKTDIRALLEEIVSTIQDRVGHEGFIIQLNTKKPLPLVKVDRSALTQAINNLIDNAIKYSTETKEVHIRIFIEDRHLIIAVKDFGIGIKKEEIDKVFERFYRGGDELTRTVKGSGLGLTLVKQIVEAHHGSVSVVSEPGCGSTFSLKLSVQWEKDTQDGKNSYHRG